MPDSLPTNVKASRPKHWSTMFSLILAGEIVFLPAFHLGRYFKSSMLTTFGIDEFQLGQLGAIYGMLATGCYFLGGPIADRWAPRKLLGISLAATGIASFYMATIPSFRIMCAIYAFWGVSTILAFWAPLIRATREYAGDDGQGRAFGVLDGGRGLASAVIASVAAHVFAAMVGGDAASNPQAELMAVRGMVVAYGCLCFAAAACVWFFVPDTQVKLIATDTETPVIASPLLRRLLLVLKSPAIWLQAVVIIAAYSAFKMLDNYGIYAEDAYGLSRSDSAKLLANVSYVRVGAALAAGWIADRLLGVRFTIQCCFLLLLLAYSLFLVVSPSQELVWLLTCNMIVSCVGFFALRGIYFALLEESGIPANLTGTAVGIISFVGFTPEIFMGPFTGWVIREARAEGNVLVGYQFIFAVLIGLSLAGAVSAFALRWFCRAQVSSARDAVSE